eukprot:TRINITY_DN7972_c0_g1_i1.p1 TRINITY_DN7972_c0_g1~~TRINITY_DN7972_c0_g1_i1.p1  ORF type:complete len:857 (+),score=108.70 TRINITY_DN7972_c0_g1_i1:28-2598(+)
MASTAVGRRSVSPNSSVGDSASSGHPDSPSSSTEAGTGLVARPLAQSSSAFTSPRSASKPNVRRSVTPTPTTSRPFSPPPVKARPVSPHRVPLARPEPTTEPQARWRKQRPMSPVRKFDCEEIVQVHGRNLPDALLEVGLLDAHISGKAVAVDKCLVDYHTFMVAAIEREVYSHLRTCPSCRTESYFQSSRPKGRRLPLAHLASLCTDVLPRLAQVVSDVGSFLSSHPNSAMLLPQRPESVRLFPTICQGFLLWQVRQLGTYRRDIRDFEAKCAANGSIVEHKRTSFFPLQLFHDRAAQRMLQFETDLEKQINLWESHSGKHFEVDGVPWSEFRRQQQFAPQSSARARARTAAASALPRPPKEAFIKVQWDDTAPAAEEAMRVVCRVRPFLHFEEQENAEAAHAVQVLQGQTLRFSAPSCGGKPQPEQEITFPACFGPQTGQAEFFWNSGVPRLLNLSLQGLTTTVFAYGQTGTGKSFTMAGPEEGISVQEGDDLKDSSASSTVQSIATNLRDDLFKLQGIIPRAVHYLFERIAELQSKNRRVTYSVTASYMEIYNERVQDLLNTAKTNLQVRQRPPPATGFEVEGLTTMPCANVDDLIFVACEGAKNRRTAPHALNRDSSRSHAILVIDITRSDTTPRQPEAQSCKTGRMYFVDLAGSERLKKSKAFGENLVETSSINKGLFALSTVINALSQGADVSAVQFRDSKLTKLLSDGLNGAGVTMLIATLSPSRLYLEESSNTISFASKATRIVRRTTKPLSPREERMRAMSAELECVRRERDILLRLCSTMGIDPTTALRQMEEPESRPQTDKEICTTPLTPKRGMASFAASVASPRTAQQPPAVEQRAPAGAGAPL